MTRFGRVESLEEGRELWINLSDGDNSPANITPVKVVTWTYGETNLILAIPHAGTIGSDSTGKGNLYCESGNIIQTRKGTNEHPIKTYARDAATDIIGHQLANSLGKEGLRPHIIECHVHRSKVECNRSLDEVAVEQREEEAEEILTTYHSWIQQAIEMCKRMCEYVPGVLLVDLHGHGHPHEYIELGYRLSADLLNAIMNKENEKIRWKSAMTSSARHEFTLRHLVRRKFGLDNVEGALVGPQSLAAAFQTSLDKFPILEGIHCLPSTQRPCPGKLGYYIGGHTVREHSKNKRVDSVQIELPLSVRTGEEDRREAITQVMVEGLLEFYNHHYRIDTEAKIQESSDESDIEEELETNGDIGAPPPPLPPPPPPPPVLASQGDGISHMTMMAKSRMHQELVNKANAFQLNRTEEVEKTMDPVETQKDMVSSHIKDFEHKMERTDDVPRPIPKPKQLCNGENHGENPEPEPLKPEPLKVPAKPKLYDSIFADRQMSDKETLRRQFLFGAPNKTSPRPPPETKPNPAKVVPEKPERSDKSEPKPPPPTLKTEVEKIPEKKKTNCCCIL